MIPLSHITTSKAQNHSAIAPTIPASTAAKPNFAPSTPAELPVTSGDSEVEEADAVEFPATPLSAAEVDAGPSQCQ
jgi:hypothetical protein